MNDDATLLRHYAERNSQEAFAEFVQRNLPLVYTAALRRLGGDAHRAKDVAQVVFCAVAREAGALSRHAMLTGWLYTATRNATVDVQRSEARRRDREAQVHADRAGSTGTTADVEWTELRPVLDGALDQLGDADREAVLLRFFQNHSYAEIGSAVGASEDAARKRVDRALDRLRDTLAGRGIRSTSAALGVALAGHAAGAVPTGLAGSVTTAALASGGAALGAATFLGLTKLQIGLTVAVVTAGAVGFVRHQHATSPSPATFSSMETRRPDDATGTSGASSAFALASPEPAGAATAPGAASSPPRAGTSRATGRGSSGAPSSAAGTGEAAGAGFDVTVSAPDVPADRRASWHRRYDPFFRERNFTPDQVERIMQLWFLQEQARFDLQAAVAAKGLRGDAPGVEKLRMQLYAPILRELREIMGEEGYAAYVTYEGTSYFRIIVTQALAAPFERARVTLAPDQIDRLAELVRIHRQSERVNTTDIGTTTRVDWGVIADHAGGILTAEQLAVLRQLVSAKPWH